MLFRRCLIGIILVATLIVSASLSAHHWVVDKYDTDKTELHELEIIEFKFINPHPLIKVSALDDEEFWVLEMDNRWELADLGFSSETFKPGERVMFTLNPSPFKASAYYVRAIDHPRLEFRYEHNRRELYPLGDASRNLLDLPNYRK